MKSTEYLVVSVLGTDIPGMAGDLFKQIAHCGCSISEARVTTMGMEFTASLLLCGPWSALAKFEAGIPAFEKKRELRILSRRTQMRARQADKLPYSSYIIATNQPTAVQKITQFLAEQSVNIHDINVTSYKAPHSEAPMLNIGLSFSISANQLIADFREQFILFCDDNNFDAAMEPQKI